MRNFFPTTVALLLAVLPAQAGTFHPMRANTQAEDFIVRAENAIKANKYDDAIINFRRARDVATTECEIGFANAGETAALTAKAWLQKLKNTDPDEAEANAAMAYRRALEQEHQKMQDGCFV